MPEQPADTGEHDELSFLDRSEPSESGPEADVDAEELQKFIDGLDERLAGAGDEIPVGEVPSFIKDGEEEKRKETVMNPGTVRVRTWHNDEDGTDATELVLGPRSTKPRNVDGATYLTYIKDVGGQLVEIGASVSYPSPFMSSYGVHARWEAGTGISGDRQGAGDSGPMSPEEARETLSGVLGSFDSLLAEAGL